MHFVCFLPSLLPRLCHLPLFQTPTVIPISGNLLLLMEYLELYHLRQIKTWTNKDTMLAQVRRFVLHGWLSQQSKGGVQQKLLEEARVECAGCLCTLGYKSGCSPPGRERVIQELREIHVHSGIANMKSLARSYTKCQSSRPSELVLFSNPFTCVRKRVSCCE